MILFIYQFYLFYTFNKLEFYIVRFLHYMSLAHIKQNGAMIIKHAVQITPDNIIKWIFFLNTCFFLYVLYVKKNHLSRNLWLNVNKDISILYFLNY